MSSLERLLEVLPRLVPGTKSMDFAQARLLLDLLRVTSLPVCS
jgi:hypothetical protein